MVTLFVTYWNHRTETFTTSEDKAERLFTTLSKLRTVRSIQMEG
jgi:hypothetical protein